MRSRSDPLRSLDTAARRMVGAGQHRERRPEMTIAIATPHPWAAEGTRRVRFGVITAVPSDWAATRDIAQTVEALGFDALFLPNHPLIAGSAAWTTLAALAEATRTIRLGTLVSCVYYWNPVVLARAVADVDCISGGRAVLGVGSGNSQHEFRQLGLAYPPTKERQAALEDALRILRPLLRGEEATYQGAHFQATRAALRPPPAQQPHVPILVAGGGARTTLRFVAQYADASNLAAASWAGGAFTPDDARRKFEILRQHCVAVGRPYESVLRTTTLALRLAETRAAAREKLERIPPGLLAHFERLPLAGTPADAVTHIRGLVETGFQYIILGAAWVDAETLRLAAEQVIPAVVDSG
jgi:alkanesulfonate monooxygenase SsuD/methylene tetrahydromethanopterin reductase-like flavin-dependent oxidoreductase (luciferase family)